MEEAELAAGGGPVEIRVAAAEEDPGGEEEEREEEARRRGRLSLSPLGGGSCSEDDSGRGCGKSSGGENDGDDPGHNWTPPDHELIVKLVAQIEYYFSDENLEKDAFLLKHVRRNKMGYVSVKLLTSFKKVKHLTRDWRTTSYALKYSEVLELNEDNRKVRRNTPVPVFPSENLPSKMLLIYDIHPASDLHAEDERQENGCVQEKMMENLLKAFVKFGIISSVRILKPGRNLPPDIKRFSSQYSQVGTKECAIVEFEEVDAAIKAHESMCVMDNETDMKVVLIAMKPPKKKVLKDKTREEDPSKVLTKTRSMNKRVEELQYVGDESSANSSSEPESDPTSPMSGRRSGASNTLSPTTYQNSHLSPNVSPRSSPWNSPSSLRKGSRMSPLAEDGRLSLSTSPETSRWCADYSSDSSVTPSSSPWVQRRRQAQTLTQEKSPVGSPVLSPKIQNAGGLPVGVLRLPRGPDGTKGFHNGYERNKPSKNE
uniref:la-related protein 6 n=1 Tax=Euleptes europaea TaxID=460621 RepID=UPI0025411E91|nr:la-related protein 6 [Euleptes europaea]